MNDTSCMVVARAAVEGWKPAVRHASVLAGSPSHEKILAFCMSATVGRASVGGEGRPSPKLADGRTLGDGEYITLEVRDTGSGIDPETAERIFEPFFTTKDVGKGTGLGLATVYAIVRQHGGTIDVRSEVGRGTTFDILLPTVDSPATAGAARTAMADSPRGHETVLVVEDEPAVRQLVAHLLERQGYRVLTAETGVRALEVFAQHRDDIDLLLTDMVMPDGLTGRTLALRLLAERPTLRVVYTSGYTADQADADVPLVRGDNFIPKPYQPSELARVIRAALDRP